MKIARPWGTMTQPRTVVEAILVPPYDCQDTKRAPQVMSGLPSCQSVPQVHLQDVWEAFPETLFEAQHDWCCLHSMTHACSREGLQTPLYTVPYFADPGSSPLIL